MKMPPESEVKNGGRISISYSTIGLIGSVLGILIALVTIGSKIATKADVESIKSTISPVVSQHEDRIRALEIQMARYFGSSSATSYRRAPTSELQIQKENPHFILTQYPQVPQIPDVSANAPRQQNPSLPSLPPRRTVVPLVMIKEYNMTPTRGGSYALLGEDGLYYSLDDVLAALIQIHIREPQFKNK
jgi:hypothetical protein